MRAGIWADLDEKVRLCTGKMEVLPKDCASCSTTPGNGSASRACTMCRGTGRRCRRGGEARRGGEDDRCAGGQNSREKTRDFGAREGLRSDTDETRVIAREREGGGGEDARARGRQTRARAESWLTNDGRMRQGRGSRDVDK